MFQCVYISTSLKRCPYKSSATCAWSMARVAEKTCLNICANNKGADQPAHPRMLISAFVVRYSSFFFLTKKRLTNLNGDQNDTGNLLCSPKNFGGAYSRRFVRASVRPCVRASVRPCVRPALVHANSRKLLVGFQWNFMGILSIKGGCAYHLRVLVRLFFQELLPFDEFCMNI